MVAFIRQLGSKELKIVKKINLVNKYWLPLLLALALKFCFHSVYTPWMNVILFILSPWNEYVLSRFWHFFIFFIELTAFVNKKCNFLTLFDLKCICRFKCRGFLNSFAIESSWIYNFSEIDSYQILLTLFLQFRIYFVVNASYYS